MEMGMEMGTASGTWIGHFLPGVAFLFWGGWWLLLAFVEKGVRAPGAPLERGLFEPGVKILALVIAVAVEHPRPGWGLAPTVSTLHHNTIYVGFALSAVVDLLARRGLLSSRATYLALAGAAFNGAFLFAGHGNHPGVESTVHRFLAWTFVAVGVSAIAEAAWEKWRLDWFRIGAMLALGLWLTVIAWILFQSGWDLMDPMRNGWAYLYYSWSVIAVTVVVLAARVVIGAGETRQGRD